MEITWLGHSCFKIKGKEATLVIDPCPPEYGYNLGNPKADIVVLTHFHCGHSYIEGVSGEPRVIKSAGEYEVADVFITGIACFHDSEQGRRRGKNIIYHILVDDLAICHLGDLGHVLTPEMAADIGNVDVLLIPTGGGSTIDAVAAAETARRLEPRFIVPMHYKTPAETRDLESIDRFLKEIGVKEVVSQIKLSLSKSSLPSTPQLVLLDYPGNKVQSDEKA